MSDYTIFDIIGPIMVGPSSSHTAGACRIGNTAIKICPRKFKKVEFILHGSFAMTYQGHGTDRALLAGIMGFETYDPRIKDSIQIADDLGIDYEFKKQDLGENYHPNTVKIIFTYEDGSSEYIIASSIGGGAINIVNINGVALNFRGEFPVILLQYHEQTGVIAMVSTLLSDRDYNIESMTTSKDNLKNIVTLTVEIDRSLDPDLQEKILTSDRFLFSKYVEV